MRGGVVTPERRRKSLEIEARVSHVHHPQNGAKTGRDEDYKPVPGSSGNQEHYLASGQIKMTLNGGRELG